ncbi:TRC40/GET3/ArsA family transport-energizing ATPase [Candidatus Chlorohelix sp.]|uniref:ArsA family ATPase n=1 Tax=Candidatus Chlorohelix sp. TaxID=3139201 RepID=UPI00305BBB02
MRIIVYTGKGGVGKTSIAAATAHRCADLGYRTIVMSTDAAHSLADSLDKPLGPEPVQVRDNLWAQEVNALHEMERNWGIIRDFLVEVLAWQGHNDIATEEMAVIPGTEELFSLIQIKRHHDSGKYDVIIVDAAPTGETLRLLSLPDALHWWLEKIFPTLRSVMKLARPLLSKVTNLPLANDDVFSSLEDILDRLKKVRDIISDPDTSSARIVVNLERMVIREAQRSLTYLNLFGYNVDAVMINRVLTPEMIERSPARAHVAEMQDKYRKEVTDSFAPLPLFPAPQFEHEIVGEQMLRQLGEELFGAKGDPTLFFFKGQAQQITKEGDNYIMRLKLPFATEDDVKLMQTGDDLVIEVGWYRRTIVLPTALARCTAVDAIFSGDILDIVFAAPKPVFDTSKAQPAGKRS